MKPLLLSNFAKHVELDDEESERVLSAFTVVTVRKNESILVPGQVCRYLSFVDKGCLRTFYTDNKGKDSVIMHQKRITTNLAETAEHRYAEFRKRYPGLEQRITQKQIASYLGITPEFLSVLRKKK